MRGKGKLRDGSRWKLSRIFYGLAPPQLLKINPHPPILFFPFQFTHPHYAHINLQSSSVIIKSFHPNGILPHIIIRKYIVVPADACFAFIHELLNLIHSQIHHSHK